jgi:hypothetical protein
MISDGDWVLNYTIDFKDNPVYDDMDGSDLSILGKSYYVSEASDQSITLLDTASTLVWEEGNSETVEIGDKSYDVTVDFINDEPSVKFLVNKKSTNSLGEGDT